MHTKQVFSTCHIKYTNVVKEKYAIGSSQNFLFRSLDSSVGIATGYGLDGRVRVPAVQEFSILHGVHTDCGAHPASYPMGTGVLFRQGYGDRGVMLSTHIHLIN
jgi:hypothetical protein